MSITSSLAPERRSFAAPMESVLSRPTDAILPRVGEHLGSTSEEPKVVYLRAPVGAFKGKAIKDPSQLRLLQYQEDEVRSLVDQSVALARANPGSMIAWSRLAQTLAGAGKTEEAVAAARRVLDLSQRGGPGDHQDASPPTRAAQFMAARVLLSGGFTQEAEAFLSTLNSYSGPWTFLYAAIAEDRGEHAQALARLGDSSGTEAAAFRGYVLLRLGRWQEAVHQLRAAGGEGSRNPGLLTNLGYAYAAVGSPRKAIRAARQAVQLAPRNRTLTFNLVSLLMHNGFAADAIVELKRLRKERGEDLKAASALAYVLMCEDRIAEARRELRRAISSRPFGGELSDYAELAANLAIVEWRLGIRTRDDVLIELRRQIDAVEGRSLPLAMVFADFVHRTTARSELSRVYQGLLKFESEENLLPLKARLQVIGGEYKDALDSAERWAELEPLNADAVQLVMTLLGQVFGEFEPAAKVGVEALRRMPGNGLLRNNVAFLLVMSGRVGEAKRLLEKCEQSSPYLWATRGLAAIASGSIEEGLGWYDKAIEDVRRGGANEEEIEEFRRFARLYEMLGLYRLGLSKVELGFAVELPEDWLIDTRYLILKELAHRVGAPWPGGDV